VALLTKALGLVEEVPEIEKIIDPKDLGFRPIDGPPGSPDNLIWSPKHKDVLDRHAKEGTMQRLLVLFLTFSTIDSAQAFTPPQDMEYETVKDLIVKGKPLMSHFRGFSACDNRTGECQSAIELAIQAIDELAFAKKIPQKKARRYANNLYTNTQGLFERTQIALSLGRYSAKLRNEIRGPLRQEISAALRSGQVDERLGLLITSHAGQLPKAWGTIVGELAATQEPSFDLFNDEGPRNRIELAKDLVQEEPPIAQYASGRYANRPRLLMFCRTRRDQRCVMIMRDRRGQIHRNADGTIWQQPSLGLSRHGKLYHETNGNTPSGVWRIDGVMPEANDQMVFGKFRRLILNFVGASQGESETKLLLNTSSHPNNWWLEDSVDRNNGRGLFRIHGTGLRSNRTKDYFPLVPTSGCVSKRERRYVSGNYKDQRELLDELMRVSGLNPVFENETRIRGLLYVFNLDDKKEAVTVAELQRLGIL